MNHENLYPSTLDSFPWSEQSLKDIYFRDFQKAYCVIEKHPGFLAHQALEELSVSQEIFRDCVRDFLLAIKQFRTESQNPDFWGRPHHDQFLREEREIRKTLFTSCTSALALADHSRRIAKSIHISGYEEKKNKIFAENEKHRFIQGLRNCISHVFMIPPDWEARHSFSNSKKDNRINFLLLRERLMNYKKWEPPALRFIQRHSRGIDVEQLFVSYLKQINHFHDWFKKEISRVSEPNLLDYRRCKRLLKGFGSHAFWRILLTQAKSMNLDPYEYLDRYFTELELTEIQSLPQKSKKQIDEMIKILDEHGICDNEIRNLAYSLFGLPGQR